jgi:PAS domain S-box-containing protein/putative nucleotidyltransferase with HDIG domain
MANVLIVDDERSIRATLAEFVREDGHDVRTAETAAEALRLVEERAPDVVVTDIILPRMSGVELLTRIHERHPDVQVIMITGEPTVETAAEAVRQGAFDYLSKPVSSDAVRSAVSRSAKVKRLVDDRRRLEQENLRYREHLEEEVERRGQALRESEGRHRAVVENAVEGIAVIQDGVICFVNPSVVAMSGYPRDALLGTRALDLVHVDDREALRARTAAQLVAEAAAGVLAVRLMTGQGQTRWVELRPVHFEWNGRPAVLNFVRDVTEEKEARQREEERERRVQEYSQALVALAMEPAVYSGDLEAALRAIAETVADALEVERVELWLSSGAETSTCAELFERTLRRHSRGRKPSLTVHPQYSAALRSERSIVASDARRDPRTSEFCESHFIPLGIGALIDVAVRLGGDVVGTFSVEHVGPPRAWTAEDIDFVTSVVGLVAVALESAKRQQAELALERREMEYRDLFEESPVSLFVEDLSGVKRALDALRASGVRDLAAYLADHPEVVKEADRSIRILDANEAAVQLHGAESKAALLDAERDGSYPTTASPFFHDRLLAIWHGERVLEATSEDETLDGRRFYAALRWSVPPGQEETLERVLLSKTDITGLVEGERRVRRALDGAIEAIGRVTEARDPYTAGHQRRVTALSVAIAEELGLDSVRVEATRAAGLLHDIGKLSIPAEILSKPSVLSSLEMSLMKTHPESAYDVLKTIDFPWPVADIVLQHHERTDGSGYPRGLKGDAILLEARILAVADVVEAMSSHRPYRAALGIDVALGEIERGRGVAYDSAAVDVCLHLFREDGFAFPNP